METPCLALNNMSELPRLLRRPLPPKILPAIIKETSTPIKQDLFVDKRPSTPCVSRINSGKGKVHSHDQAEHKYPLNDQTQYGVFMNHRGPEDFPSRRQFKKPLANVLPLISDDPRYQPPPPEFTLGDITAHASHRSTMQIDLLDQPVVSHHHYTNMELLIYKLQNRPQSKIHSVLLSAKEIPEMSKRIPYPQLLLEHRKQNLTEGEEYLQYTGEDTLHPLLKSQYLQCSEVAHSAKGHDQNKVLETYCELAILESLIHGGKSLSLKAYFIYKLPDLIPLHETLSYLNLSFNDFRLFPTEVYMLENLEVLKLRNNPINEIPYGIHNLKKLRTLIMSFCLLSSLPAGLFLLGNLQTLDVSYNSICSIPKDIGNLRLLEFLNVEGNSLPALPCEALKLKLKYLRVANNEMHPLFWRENTCIKPQKLTDLAALSFAKNNMWHHVKKIPNDVKKILDKVDVCDCCTGPLYGQGLFFIRPCEKIFGIRKLPFMFQACSPSCYKNFMCQRESLTEHLYGC